MFVLYRYVGQARSFPLGVSGANFFAAFYVNIHIYNVERSGPVYNNLGAGIFLKKNLKNTLDFLILVWYIMQAPVGRATFQRRLKEISKNRKKCLTKSMTCDILDELAARQTVAWRVPCKLNNVKKPENTEKVREYFFE